MNLNEHQAKNGHPFKAGSLRIPSFALVETLIHGLHITEMSFDYIHAYKDPEPVFAKDTRLEINRAIWSEARGTMEEFNKIARYIGGIPVRMQHIGPGSTDGRITSLENYEAGDWVFNLRTQPYSPGREVRGTSLALRDWYHATTPAGMANSDEVA